MRTGGLASTRTFEPLSGSEAPSWAVTEVAGTAGSSDSTTSWDWAPPGANAPWTCICVDAADSVDGDAEPLRARRTGPRSALLRPTRLSPSPPPDAAGLDRSISASSCAGASEPPSGAAGASAGSPIAMIGVPTATVSPSATISAVTTPANGEGSSTSDFAVSISTTMSLISTVSPSLTRQETISASVRPSPTSGSLYSATSGLLVLEGAVDGVEQAVDVGEVVLLDA